LRGAPLTEEWRQLRKSIVDRAHLTKLSGLIRYCSMKGIVPAAVTEAVVDDYMRHRRETTALAIDIKARRAIARAWNASRKLPGWPQQLLVEPPLKTNTEWPQWRDFPASLQEDIDNYLISLTKPRRGIDKKRLGACKPSTIRTRRNDLVSLAKRAVRLGVAIDSLTSMQRLLDPEIVALVFDDEWKKAGDEPKTTMIDLGKKVLAIARSTGCVDGAAFEKLGEIRSELEKYRQGGMTPKNMKLIRQVLNEKVWERVINCPTELMKQARSLKDKAPGKAAVTAQIAVAIAILTEAPVRAANLAGIRLDENLIKPGGPEAPYLLVFPHYDVKNRVDLTFEFDDYLTGLIDEYIQRYRPRLLRGANGDWLFPATTGGVKTPHFLSIQITDRIQKATGLRINVHQFRHAAAAIYLKHHPGDYETVRRFLGHKSLKTTINFYCGLETIQASREFSKIIRQHRRFDDDGPLRTAQ
jgi:integrase